MKYCSSAAGHGTNLITQSAELFDAWFDFPIIPPDLFAKGLGETHGQA